MGSPGLPELFLLLPLALLVVPAIFYLLTLRKALSICAPDNRTLSPGRVWLLLVPVFNIFWHFVVVLSISRSQRNELRQRNLPTRPPLGLSLGLGMCCLSVLAFVPALSGIAALGAFICWFAYWVTIAKDCRRFRPGLGATPQA